MSEFIRIFNEVSRQVEESVSRGTYYPRAGPTFDEVLNIAVDAWCDRLPLENQQSIRLKRQVRASAIQALIQFHWNEWKRKEEKVVWLNYQKVNSKFHDLVKGVFKELLNQEGNNMKFIVLIAFAIVAVGFVIYLLNRPNRRDDSPSPPTPPSTPTSSRPPTATVTRQCLILVIDAAHGDIVESIKNKGRIDPEDCTLLYEATKYLSMKPENGLTQFSQVINQYGVSPGEELSEFDVYLVKIELRQPDEGLGGNVDNQLDRQDAFNRLPQLAANIQVSQRLRMEAAERFDVYYR